MKSESLLIFKERQAFSVDKMSDCRSKAVIWVVAHAASTCGMPIKVKVLCMEMFIEGLFLTAKACITVCMCMFVDNFVSLLSRFNDRQITAPKNQWVNGHSRGKPKRDGTA